MTTRGKDFIPTGPGVDVDSGRDGAGPADIGTLRSLPGASGSWRSWSGPASPQTARRLPSHGKRSQSRIPPGMTDMRVRTSSRCRTSHRPRRLRLPSEARGARPSPQPPVLRGPLLQATRTLTMLRLHLPAMSPGRRAPVPGRLAGRRRSLSDPRWHPRPLATTPRTFPPPGCPPNRGAEDPPPPTGAGRRAARQGAPLGRPGRAPRPPRGAPSEAWTCRRSTGCRPWCPRPSESAPSTSRQVTPERRDRSPGRTNRTATPRTVHPSSKQDRITV